MSKILYRSKENRVIAGVSGGLGDYLDVDSVIIRVIFVVSAFAAGAGIAVYIALWLLIPEKDGRSLLEEISEDIKEGQQKKSNGAEKADSESVSKEAPEMRSYQTKAESWPPRLSGGRSLLGLTLVSLGLIILFDRLIPDFNLSAYFWPAVLIGLGLTFLLKSSNRR